MNTDTKTVARWDVQTMDERTSSDGRWVLFTDHERVVGDLKEERMRWFLRAGEYLKRAQAAEAALAASRAEVDGLKKDAERYRWLKDNCEAVADEYATAGQLYFGTYLYGNIDSAIDAAMEKGNV